MAATMDITKLGSRCHSELASNFSEQFSDSSSNNGDISRAQHTNTATSPVEETVHFTKTESSPLVMEGDLDTLGNSNGSTTALTSPNSKNALTQQVPLSKVNSNIPLSSSIREEKEIKKEETSLSPQNVSPLGQSCRENNDDNGTPTLNKSSILSPLSCEKGVSFFRNACNSELQERSKSAGLLLSTNNVTLNFEGGGTSINANMSPKSNVDSLGSNNLNVSRNVNHFNNNLTKYNCPSHGEGAGGCTDYMQQQNHVFVFSTQLANRSAEAVLGGQFSTIIAYHCCQPSTKMFLEDFLKNPARTTKLQRQYSLNLMSIMQSGLSRPGCTQSHWSNDCNNLNKFIPRPALRNIGANKNNPALEHTFVLDNQPCVPNPLHILNNADGFNNMSPSLCGIKVEDKSPSLQGVKVPDENLTPQQRQHREEQLAKLKKMNKFLFPENEGHDFNLNPDGVVNNSTGSSGEAAGNCTDVHSGSTLKKQSASGIANTDSGATKVSASNINVKSRVHTDESNNTGIENNQDMTSSLNANNCPSSEAAETVGDPSNMNLSSEDWAKLQNNAYVECFKNRHSHGHPSTLTGDPTSGQHSSSLSRSLSLSLGVAGYGMQSRPNTGPSPTNRNNNDPPPPYHQRSASVPIATQSPNHASHKNPNTDMSLPSLQSSHPPFGVATTPTEDVSNLSTVIPNSTHSSTSSFVGLQSGNPKNVYSRDCPTQIYAHSTAALNSLATTNAPPTSLSHLSPREIDKSKRSSPQKSKSPSISDLQEGTCTEPKYANFGLNYSTCGMPAVNSQNFRHNMQTMSSQFCRRIDNIPLNPNCNRVSQNKPASSFDPIASLAQMSQQLTGSGLGLSTIGTGNSVSGGMMDVNSGELMAGPGGRDPMLDHCNQMANNNMGVMGLAGALGRVTGQFAPDINNMLCGESGSIDQRMLNGKLCLPGNFNHNVLTGVGLRDTVDNRNLNRRIPSNFDNFSMAPNIHVKVSAPNTIQYMPARSQNLNNMRVPPNMEFFQRYGNPQVIGNMGAGVGNSSAHMSNDMMNLFGNCGQMSAGVGQLNGRGRGGYEQNDLEVEGHLLPNDVYMNVP